MTEIADKQTIVFGTDGIRGNADQFPFTSNALIAFGHALGVWAQKKYAKQNPKILIGSDTRISSPRIKNDLCQGLLAQGTLVVDAGILPTPSVYQLIATDETFDVGIVISASHNPYQDNGIKVFDARHCKITSQDEQEIAHIFSQRYNVFVSDTTSCHPVPLSRDLPKKMRSCLKGQDGKVFASETTITSSSSQKMSSIQEDAKVITWPAAQQTYNQAILSRFPEQFLKNIKVVLDCAHGATYQVAPDLFRALGADVHVLAASPSGTNINDQCGALHPELLAQVVHTAHADCGFAFDGDGDRVVAVNKHGVIKDGDDILALLLQLPAYNQVLQVVGTVMTNQGFESHLRNLGKKLIRTNVGDKYISAQLDQEQLPLGGEASGHIIMKDYLSTGDGIFVALRVLESIIVHNNWDMKTFDKYPQILINVPVEQKKDLAQSPFTQIITDHEKILGQGRLVVRYSGTENLLRVMTEATTYNLASRIANAVACKLQKALKTP